MRVEIRGSNLTPMFALIPENMAERSLLGVLISDPNRTLQSAGWTVSLGTIGVDDFAFEWRLKEIK